MEFEWDDSKNQSNRRKHGIAFEDAIEVFDDLAELTLPARTVAGETRWQTIGLVRNTVLIVVYTYRTNMLGERIPRVISARQASRTERADYERAK